MNDSNEGVDKTFTHTVKAAEREERDKLFQLGMDRLFDVNNWHRYAGKGSAVFQRMDAQGLALTGNIQPDDFIRIDLPGIHIGRGFDWVAVDEICGGSYWAKMVVRPCPDPTAAEGTTAHFLTEEATSTFIVEYDGLEISAIILGKNEKPNDESKGLLQKARDVLVGLGAIAGASDIQWNRLVKGFLETESDD